MWLPGKKETSHNSLVSGKFQRSGARDGLGGLQYYYLHHVVAGEKCNHSVVVK